MWSLSIALACILMKPNKSRNRHMLVRLIETLIVLHVHNMELFCLICIHIRGCSMKSTPTGKYSAFYIDMSFLPGYWMARSTCKANRITLYMHAFIVTTEAKFLNTIFSPTGKSLTNNSLLHPSLFSRGNINSNLFLQACSCLPLTNINRYLLSEPYLKGPYLTSIRERWINYH